MTPEEPLPKPRFWWMDTLLLVLVVALPILLRTVLMSQKAMDWAWLDTAGLWADLAAGLLAASLVWWSLKVSRVLANVLVVVWVAVNFALFEYVRVFEAVDVLGHLSYLLDPTFFKGSVSATSHTPIIIGVMLALSVPVWWKDKGEPGKRTLWGLSAAALVGILCVPLWSSIQSDEALWRQRNLLLTNLALLASGPEELKGEESERAPDDASLVKLFEPDLSGRAWLKPTSKKPNVLVILLEGVSGGYLPSVARKHSVDYHVKMTRLDALARQHTSFSTLVAQQRQTNRGEYAILCGDYPKLDGSQAKMSEIVQSGKKQRCLPAVLAEAGYETVYLQAAPLAFMFKDQFMAQVGFDQIHGDTWFEDGYARSSWGVDDRAFMAQSLNMVRKLQASDKPWFLTLLSVGTHHPFIVPEDFESTHTNDNKARALDYLDLAIGEFVEALGKEGVLDDTIVILTSDESSGLSRGVDSLTRSLSQSWSFLVLMVPGQPPQSIHAPFVHSDLALSVVDHLSLSDQAPPFAGRSIFRHYDDPRPLVFSNVYRRRTFSLGLDGILTTCAQNLSACTSYRPEPSKLFSPRRKRVAKAKRRIDLIRQVASLSRRTTEPDQGPRKQNLLSVGKVDVLDLAGYQIIFGGQYLQVEANTRIDMVLEVEATGPKEGLVELTHNMTTRQGSLYRSKKAMLRGGDGLLLTYTALVKEPRTRLESRLFVRKLLGEGMALEVRRATITFSPLPRAPKKTRTIRRHLEYKRGEHPTNTLLTLSNPEHFSTPKCALRKDGKVRAQDCPAGHLLYGPYTYVPKGATVRIVMEFEGLADVSVYSDATSRTGRRKHRVTPPMALVEGQRERIDYSFVANEEINDLEVRLWMEPKEAKGTTLDLHSMTLEITLGQ